MAEPAPGAAPPSPARPEPPMPPMCFACGQMLQPGQAKCPACGAPVRTLQRPRRGAGRLSIAAFLFLGLTLLTGLQAGLLLTDPDGLLEASPPLPTRRFDVAGTVVDANGTALPGANVSVAGESAARDLTDETGAFELHNLSAGYHQINSTSPDGASTALRIFLFRDEHATLRVNASQPDLVADHPSYGMILRVAGFCGSALVGLGLLLVAGAVACFRRRNYGLALTAAILSFPVALVSIVALGLSVVLVILVVRARSEFR